MKRVRLGAVALTMSVMVAACGSGKKIDDAANTTAGGVTTTTSDECTKETPKATEIGVSASEITIAVTADTGSPIKPGLFQGSVDSIKAWAEYKNANGGLACRKIDVKVFDSKLSPDEAKNSLTSACGSSFALVGTTALFLNDVAPIETCKDQAGKATGITDFAVLQTEPAQQCSQWDFAVLPGQGTCPYSGKGERDFKVADGPFQYYLNKFGKDALHGVWVVPADLPSTISSSMPGFRYSQKIGIKLDKEFGTSGLSPQSAYTPFVQAIKDNKATYARNGLDYSGTVLLRKEAAVQNVDTVKVWDCSVQCYDKRLITEGGSAVEGQNVWLSILPLEDAGSNATLDALLKYNSKPDGFGIQAWAAAEAFATSVENVVAEDGINGLTRASILEAVRNLHDFDAGGLIPKMDIGGKNGSNCFLLMQVIDGKFKRVEPTKPGTFNCDGKVDTIRLDASTTFKP